MALPIRDGNQSLTTLSTILVSNSHIPAHTVISFGTQGITDIATAVSGVELGPNTLSALENITVTLGQVTITGGLTDAQLRASAVTIGGTVTVGSIVTHGVTIANSSVTIGGSVTATISGTPSVTFSQASVTFGTAVITGSTSIIGTPSVTFTQIATHGVTIGAGTAQIGSVTASISGTPSITFGTAVITGSASILNFPATQTVTFTQASVTFGTAVITGSASIIGTPSVTFTQIATHGVTIANNSVTVNGAFYQATQPVSIASVTIGNSVTISSIPSISGTVTANVPNIQVCTQGSAVQSSAIQTALGVINTNNNSQVLAVFGSEVVDGEGTSAFVQIKNQISGTVTIGSALPTGTNRIGVVTIGGGTVTIGAGTAQIGSVTASISNTVTASISGTVPISISSVTIGSALPAGTNRIGVVTIGAGTVTIGAGTAQIGSVTASVFGVDILDNTIPKRPSLSSMSETFSDSSSGYALITKISSSVGNPINPLSNTELRATAVTIAGSVTIGAGIAQIGSVTVGNSVTIGSLPAISGTVTANLAISSTAITKGSFASLTSATLVPANTARKMATVYNLGAGQLFVNAGATATTLGGGFMVALNAGDFYECNYTTTTLSAIFATAGTASWMSH
jgi:hypothetical protein